MDHGFQYQARKLQKELDDRYGGDLTRMSAKYGFNPIFVQVPAPCIWKCSVTSHQCIFRAFTN